jgi:hypothetical protein
MSDFSTSTPAKKRILSPSPDDSGVSIQMSDVTETDKMLSSSDGSDSLEGKKSDDITTVDFEMCDGISGKKIVQFIVNGDFILC